MTNEQLQLLCETLAGVGKMKCETLADVGRMICRTIVTEDFPRSGDLDEDLENNYYDLIESVRDFQNDDNELRYKPEPHEIQEMKDRLAALVGEQS